MKYVFVLVVVLVISYVGYQSVATYLKTQISQQLVQQNQVFEHESGEAETRILFVGDSTAAGVGAKAASSTAGWFHQDFPQAEIVNVAKSGAKLSDAVQQIEQVQGNFDLAVIQAGANDIIGLTALHKAKETLEMLLSRAQARSDHIVMLTSGNIGLAPFFPPVVGAFYSWQAKRYLTAFENVAKDRGVVFVDLYTTKENDLFSGMPEKYYAADGLHLSGAGYQYWHEQIRQAMKRAGIDLDIKK